LELLITSPIVIGLVIVVWLLMLIVAAGVN
jgi:hypothetical protein